MEAHCPWQTPFISTKAGLKAFYVKVLHMNTDHYWVGIKFTFVYKHVGKHVHKVGETVAYRENYWWSAQ